MTNEKQTYAPAEIKIVLLDRDLLISSGGTLDEDKWDSFNFTELN